MTSPRVERAGELSADELGAAMARIFGGGDRRLGWFERKCAREAVCLADSLVARSGTQIVGLALLGRPPSLGSTARGAGLAVDRRFRAQGLGARLYSELCAVARAGGAKVLRTDADARASAFYLGQGASLVREQATLLAWTEPGKKGSPPWGERRALEALPGTRVASWLPEAWHGTPPNDRARLESEGARAWISREGVALLVQHLDFASSVDAARVVNSVEALRSRLPGPVPLLLYGCTSADPATAALLETGWAAAQRSVIVHRYLV